MFFSDPVKLYPIELARKAASTRFFVSAADEVLYKSHKPISHFYRGFTYDIFVELLYRSFYFGLWDSTGVFFKRDSWFPKQFSIA